MSSNMKYLFKSEERFELMKKLLENESNIVLHLWDRLIVDYAKKYDIKVILRGVRAIADFGYEFELAMTNKELYPDIEIVFMPTDPKYFVLRSSAIKEIAKFGGDISTMVPSIVSKALQTKVKGAWQKSTNTVFSFDKRDCEVIMAVPKYKTSKSRSRRRRSINMKLNAPNLIACNTCGNKVVPHRVCPKCGFYKGKQVLNLEEMA